MEKEKVTTIEVVETEEEKEDRLLKEKQIVKWNLKVKKN